MAALKFLQALGLAASAAAGAPLNIPHGAAPTTPADGDVWSTTAGFFFQVNGATVTAGTGSVTSVALALPGEFSVSGSPVTGAGTLTGAWANQTTNKVFAAPNGSTGTPTFRLLAAADIPALSYVTSVALALPPIFSVSGSPITTSGTLTATLASQTANTVFAAPDGAPGAPTFRALVSADLPALAYVTSVALALPAEFSVSGSPVTSSGTLTGAWATQTTNKVFAAPNGSTGTPTFRALVGADVPLTTTQIGFGSGSNALTSSSALTWSGSVLGVSANVGAAGGGVNASNASTTGWATVLATNNNSTYVEIVVDGSGRTLARFGQSTLADWGRLEANGASVNGLAIGVLDYNKPILFGIFNSEVGRFSSSALSTGTFSVSYTTDATTASTGAVTIAGGLGVAKSAFFGGLVSTVASTTASAGLTVPHGAAPTAPNDGDLWSTTSGFFGRVNGVTVSFSGGGGGSVTSVALALPGEFTISGSPVTTSGTLTGTWATQTTNKVFAAPNGSTGTPTFRALVAADIPTVTNVTLASTQIGFGNGSNLLSGSANLTYSGSAISHSATSPSIVVTSTSASGSAFIQQVNDGGLNAVGELFGTTASGTVFGVNRNNSYAFLVAKTGSANVSAMFVGIHQGGTLGAPVIFGATNTSNTDVEVFRYTYNLVTIAQPVSATNTTDSTTTATGALIIAGGLGVAKSAFFGGLVSTVASATGTAGFRLPHGTAPTSPVNGDLWTTTAGLFSRINGATVQFSSGLSGSGSANQIAYWSGTSTLTSDAVLTNSSTGLGVDGTAATSNIIITNAQASAGAGEAYVKIRDGANDKAIYATLYGPTYVGTSFGLARASAAGYLVSGSVSRLIIGIESTNSPISIGINASEVAQFTSGTLSTGKLSVSYTTDSTTSTTGAVTIAGGLGVAKSAFFGGLVSTVASATGTAGFRLPHGAAPTSPVNGDLWTTTAGLFARINGSTVQYAAGISGSATSGQMTYWNGTASVTGSANLTYNGTSDLIMTDSGSNIVISSVASNTIGAARVRAKTSTNIFLDIAAFSPTATAGGTIFGFSVASSVGAIAVGTGLNRFLLGPSGVDAPISVGINASEVTQFTSGTLSTGSVAVKYTTDSTTSTTGAVTIAGGLGVAKAAFFGGLVSTVASATGTAGFRLPHGAAPTSPVNGDTWTTTAGLFARINGSTVQFGSGTVTSVALALPGEFSVSGSPVTTTGTLTGAWATQTTNKVFAAPNGSTGTPTFRALVSADIPLTATQVGFGSGSNTLSSSANLTYAPTTGTGGLTIANTTAATTSSTGALIVTGGAGIGGDVYVGGTLLYVNASASTSVQVYARNSSAADGAYGQLTVSGDNALTQLRTYSSGTTGNYFSGHPKADSTSLMCLGSNGIALLFAGQMSFGDNSGTRYAVLNQSVFSVELTTTSTSPTTGALVVAGGVGISGALNILGITTFSAAVNPAALALSDGANIATDASLANSFSVTLGGNRTLDDPTNLVNGSTYVWVITQDGVGSRTLAYGSVFSWPAGATPALSTAAGAVDLISAYYDGTKLRANLLRAFA